MPKVKQPPPKTKEARPQTGAAGRAAIVDELAEIEPLARDAKRIIERAEILRRTMRQWADLDGKKDTDSMVVQGKRFRAEIGPKELNRVVDTVAAFRVLGKDRFIARAILYPKALEDLPVDEQDKILRQQRVGARAVKVSPRG